MKFINLVIQFFKKYFRVRTIHNVWDWIFTPRKMIWRIPLVLVGLFLLFNILSNILDFSAPTPVIESLRSVELLNLAESGTGLAPLQVVGEVTPLDTGEIRAEAGGRIILVNKKIGDRVSAGEIIATLENNTQRAQALSAEGAVEGAQAALSRVSGGSRAVEILTLDRDRAQNTLKDTNENIVSTLKSIYGSNDDAVHGKLDVLFSNPRTPSPKFILTTSDSRLVSTIEESRIQIETLLTKQQARSLTLDNNTALNIELDTALSETRAILLFVDAVADAVNRTIPNTQTPSSVVSGYSASISGVRLSLSGSLSQISGLQQSLTAAEAGAKISAAQFTQGSIGRPEDVAQAEAGLKQARGAYALALAQLEKTILRSPIYGEITNLSVERGQYINPPQLVAVVSNNQGLQIKTFVAEEDAPFIAIGNKVALEGNTEGTIIRIASSIDPVSKRIEIRVAIPSNTSGLTSGQVVSLSIPRNSVSPVNIGAPSSEVSLPLSAIKLSADSAVVFTVDESNKLVEHKIKLGPLLGDRIIVLSGLDGLTSIVKDARGLKSLQEVELVK